MKTGIQIHTTFFPLAWFLYFCTTVIEIDGEQHKKSWGTNFFELQPGEHNVKIFFPYLFKPECGANSVTIDVKEGETIKLKYNMPPWMLSKGKITLS